MMRVVLIVLTLVLLGCGEKPKDAYNRLVFNARMGNEAAFLDGFTEESGRLIKTLLALRRTYGGQMSGSADPYTTLVLEEVENVAVESKEFQIRTSDGGLDTIKRDVAVLTVTDGKIRRKIRMIEFDDGWKIDALDLQNMWKQDKGSFLSR